MTTTEEIQGWSVTVEINAETVLTIEHNSVSGLGEFTDEQAEVIRGCAGHLRAFIGEPSGAPEGALAQAQVEAVPVCFVRADELEKLNDPRISGRGTFLSKVADGRIPLYATANAALAAPPGFKLVPIDPTPEMIDAGVEANATSWDQDTDNGFPREVSNDVYRAMLAAAPKSGEQK